jgi:2'-5' RNA ligase
MHVFWLSPERHAREAFDAIIHQLAKQFDAPVFDPHVTLFGGDMDSDAARALFRELARTRAPVELEVAGIEWSENYTKTLYVQFRPSAQATALSEAVRTAMGGGDGYEFNPHLSLLYKDLPEETKRAAAATVRLPAERVLFNGLDLVRVPGKIDSRDDVEAWETLASCWLRGAV